MFVSGCSAAYTASALLLIRSGVKQMDARKVDEIRRKYESERIAIVLLFLRQSEPVFHLPGA